MTVRLDNDAEPGYAILDFGRDIGVPELQISIKSNVFHSGAFLAPGGKWSETAHFFPVGRLAGEGQGAFRIGPEVVNYVVEFDAVVISTASGDISEDVTWPRLARALATKSADAIAAAGSEPTAPALDVIATDKPDKADATLPLWNAPQG